MTTTPGGAEPATVTSALGLTLVHEPVTDEQLVGGAPSTGYTAVSRFGGHEVGVWEMTPGVMRDVEVDEVFVVVAGAAVVEIEGQDAPLTLAPGDIVTLAEGMKTVWTVTETLRKVYLS